MKKDKTKQENKAADNSAVADKTEQSSEKAELHSENENRESLHRERTVDFESLPSDLTIGELQEEARMVEDENEAVESPLDRYIRTHRELVEKAKSQLGQGQTEETADSASAAENSVASEEVDKAASVEKEKEIKTEPSDNSSNEAETEDEVKDKEESDDEKSAQADLSDSQQFDELETAEEDDSEVLTESASDEKKADDERLDKVSDNDLSANETDGENNEEDQAQTETSDVLEGKLVDERKSKVIFPVPMAAEAVENTSNQEITAEDSKSSHQAVSHADSTPFDEVKLAKGSEDEATLSSQASETAKEKNDTSEKKSRKAPIIAATAAILILGVAGATYLIQQHSPVKQQATRTISSSEKKAITNFDKAYAAFFVDNEPEALKNSQFAQLPDLKAKLSVLAGGDKKTYEADTTKYNQLSDDISAIQSINAIFDKAVIVDGKFDKTATVKDKATVPTVSSKNSSLNGLLQEAVGLAKTQQANQEKAAASAAASSQAAAASSAAAAASSSASSAAGNNSDSGQVNGSITGEAAYTWAPGVLSQFISTVQSRGIIKGNNYSLVPAGIHTTNGNIYGHNGVITGHTVSIVAGYYNLYNSDGQYLVTVNCKTGYFWGTTNPKDY